MASREGGPPTTRGNLPVENSLSERDKVLYRKIVGVIQETYPDRDWLKGELRESLLQNLMKAQLLKTPRFEVTDESHSVAASALALQPEDWLEWASSVDLNLNIKGASFPDVHEAKAGVRYPVSLRSLREEYYESIENGMTFARTVKDWITQDRTIVWDSNSHHPPFWDLLINEWSFARDAVNSGVNGSEQRCLVESMMTLIFSRSMERRHRSEVFIEKEMALPRPKSRFPPRLKSSCARPDIAVMVELPICGNIFHRTRDVLTDKSVLHCLKHFGLSPNQVLLGIFAMETKRFDDVASPRLLATHLSSMQYQRRALGLKDRFIYGATLCRGVFQLYASYWDDREQLWCCKVSDASWDLNTPDGFIKCLYFLRTLREHIDTLLEDDLRGFSIDNLVSHLQRNPQNWRAEPSKRSGDFQGRSTKRPRLDEGEVDDDASMGDDDPSGSSPDTPQKKLERIFDIVTTSHAKACEFVKWRHALPSVPHKET